MCLNLGTHGTIDFLSLDVLSTPASSIATKNNIMHYHADPELLDKTEHAGVVNTRNGNLKAIRFSSPDAPMPSSMNRTCPRTIAYVTKHADAKYPSSFAQSIPPPPRDANATQLRRRLNSVDQEMHTGNPLSVN